MNLLRWIVGIPLAFAISIGLIMLNSDYGLGNNYLNKNVFVYLLYYLSVNILCFFLAVFLSCIFIPYNKRYAALIAVVISLSFIVIGLYFKLTDSLTYGQITMQVLINQAGIVFGLLAGTYVSYEVFKNKGWRTPKNIDPQKEVY